MSNFLAFKRPSPDATQGLRKILEEGTAINLGHDASGATVYLLIDFDRNDRRPLVTINVAGQYLSPQDYLNNVQSRSTSGL